MKIIFALLFVAVAHFSYAKESREADQAIKRYQDKEPTLIRINVTPQVALADLVTKEKDLAAKKATVEEVFSVLAVARDSQAKELIPQLKELWKMHQKSTFRVIFGKGWRSVKSRDYNQEICDEIKILIKGIGGLTEDLVEPTDQDPKLPEK